MTTQQSLAKQIAIIAHANQLYGIKPYTAHLLAVHDVLYFDLDVRDDELLAAAWLHDVLEDTSETVASLVAKGVETYVLALVDAVTDRPGKNRAARHRLTYPRIARMDQAVLLKLADRIANMRNSSFMRPDLMDMYRGEYAEFRMALYHNARTGRYQVAWDKLDELMQEK